ncbi:MAG: hypothetical protein CMJ77_11415 [Planctomycetaceae bacterium]|nr:hypothetical protein [Planctomycetaceae bacterium]
MSEVLRIGSRITALPVIHGSADCALEVRRVMLDQHFDCVAVPLPPSFRNDVLAALDWLPTPTLITQREAEAYGREWSPEDDLYDDSGDSASLSYVPIDPCQPVIAALRIAQGERLPCEFIDLETARFEPVSATLPDAYALKKVNLERFAAAMLPSIPPPDHGQPRARIEWMAHRLRELEQQYQSILFICSVLDWPWIRGAYCDQVEPAVEEDLVEETESYAIDPNTLIFTFGELPFITALHERARAELEDDENLSIDGIKELLLTAREAYLEDFHGRARKITPHLLAVCLRYVRNLTLLERRLTPDLYSIVIAAKQICGDGFALHVAETARNYPYLQSTGLDEAGMGIDQIRLPDGDVYSAKSRLPGPPMTWRSCELRRRPDKTERERWAMKWNPMSQCSWPPEDDLIENFRAHVCDRAKQIMGADLVRTEKFTTSIKDGIDIRDTLRNWHTQEIYVKVLPPSRGKLDAVVMLFDCPADPRDYPWRTTWFAEHQNESTLAFFGTDFSEELVGPGIGLANYGGAMFLFPPVSIPDIWIDPRLDFTETLEERLLAAACLHSSSPTVALLSAYPPGAAWRRLAKRFSKKWIHVPLAQFSDATVQQLRMVHVLNGHQIRSYASHFIRKA